MTIIILLFSLLFVPIYGNNSTIGLQQTPSIDVLKMTQFLFFVLSGLSAVVSSLIIMLTIAFNKSLRTKDFYLLAGLAGADFLRGYGYLHGGIQRTIYVATLTEKIQVTPYDCMMQIYQTFMLFGQQCSPMMILVLSLDRFLAVVMYIRYRQFGKRYALILISIVYGFCALVTSFGWISALTVSTPPGTKITQLCQTETVTPIAYFTFHIGTRCMPGLISIALYVSALCVLKSKSGMQASDRKRESRLTKNVALISVNTTLFMTFPFGYMFLRFTAGFNTSAEFDLISPFILSLSLFGAAANFFIYSWKYKQFRDAAMKCCFFTEPVAVSDVTSTEMTVVKETVSSTRSTDTLRNIVTSS